MKTSLLPLIALLTIQTCSTIAATPEEETRFLTAAKRAFGKHDADALSALTCWDRVPDRIKASGQKTYARDAAQNVTDLKLTNPDPQFADLTWKDAQGVAYRSNLPVTKQLKITFADGGRFKTGIYPVGEKEGKLYLLEPAPIEK